MFPVSLEQLESSLSTVYYIYFDDVYIFVLHFSTFFYGRSFVHNNFKTSHENRSQTEVL